MAVEVPTRHVIRKGEQMDGIHVAVVINNNPVVTVPADQSAEAAPADQLAENDAVKVIPPMDLLQGNNSITEENHAALYTAKKYLYSC